MRSQHAALNIAITNLASHVVSVSLAFSNFEPFSSRELARQQQLLEGHDTDMDVISKVKISSKFLKINVKKALVPAVAKDRYLGEYVSRQKMAVVAESCQLLHRMPSLHPSSIHP